MNKTPTPEYIGSIRFLSLSPCSVTVRQTNVPLTRQSSLPPLHPTHSCPWSVKTQCLEVCLRELTSHPGVGGAALSSNSAAVAVPLFTLHRCLPLFTPQPATPPSLTAPPATPQCSLCHSPALCHQSPCHGPLHCNLWDVLKFHHLTQLSAIPILSDSSS